MLSTYAQLFAVFEPLRDCKSLYWSAVWALRTSYSAQGLPYRGAGTMEYARSLDRCTNNGWLIRKRGRTRTTGVLFTPSGLKEAEKLLGIDANTASVVTEEVIRLGGGERWVRETEFNGNRGWGDGHQEELRLIAFTHGPALLRGWVESHCDTCGRVGYRVTRTGLKAPAPSTDYPDETLEPDGPAFDAFHRAYGDSILWLNSLGDDVNSRERELGQTPLGTSVWARHGDDVSRLTDDA